MRIFFFKAFQFLLLLTSGIFLLYLIRFQSPLPTNVLEMATAVLFVIWLFGIIALRFPRPELSKWQMVGVSLFLFAATIATVRSVIALQIGEHVVLGIWKGWFIAPTMYYLMLVSSFRTRKDYERLLEVSLGIIAFTAGVMLLQFYIGIFSSVTETYDHRLVWPYLDPWTGKGTSGNYPAMFLAPFLCLSWMMLLKSEDLLSRLYFGLSVVVMAVAVYFTKSYGAWLAIIGACSLASFFMVKGAKRWIATPLLCFIFLLGLYVDQRNTEKFRYGLDITDESVISSGEERFNIWKVSWDLIKRDALFGVGPGQFQKAFSVQAPLTLDREVSRTEINHALHPHNTYFMFWLSDGLLGLLSFLFLLGVFFIPLPKEWRLIFAAPLLYLLAHGEIDVLYFKNDLAYGFWFFGALMTIAKNMNSLMGKVTEGIKLGREMGFPTVNIQLETAMDRPHGVYAVDVRIGKEKKKGLLYFGQRKTKGLPENIVCEITILDFEGDLYGKKLHFTIGEFIRGPREFDSVAELKKQIEKDVLIAKHRKLV